MTRFQVGDRVVVVDTRYDDGHSAELLKGLLGKKGTVSSPYPYDHLDYCLSVKWDDPSIHCGDCYAWRFEIDKGSLLAVDRPITTRDGQPVTVEATGDPARPYAATVRGQRLTFEPTGRFYPTMDQPIDLVNT